MGKRILDQKKLIGGKSYQVEPFESMNKTVGTKIRSLDALSEIIAELKDGGKRVVQCHGVFDLVHLGHIRHLNLAKKEGDVLVVTLTADRYVRKGPDRPVFNESQRAEMLASLAVTDYVCVVDSPTAVDSIGRLKPNVYAKGPDYKDKDRDVTGCIHDEEEAVESVGGRLAITEDITFSSSSLINNYFDVYAPGTLEYLKSFRQKYTADEIRDRLLGLQRLKVLIVGDAIIDQYHYCLPMGKSSKEPLVANRYVSEEMFAGGALATANHAAAVCGSVDLLTALGDQESFESFIREHLASNVTPKFIHRQDTQTIVKRRYVGHDVGRKLFEICYLQDTPISGAEEDQILRFLDGRSGDYDLIVVNDFGHGLLTEKVIQRICGKARYLALNVQTNSANIGFNLVTKYPRANCVCIDEMELRYATHDRYGDLRSHAAQIYDLLHCEHLIATRGPDGSLSYSREEGFCEMPAFSYRVIDAIGAGDAFFAYVAPCFAAGLPQDLVSFIGNAVGSLAVQIVCNRAPVGLVDLLKFITRLLK